MATLRLFVLIMRFGRLAARSHVPSARACRKRPTLPHCGDKGMRSSTRAAPAVRTGGLSGTTTVSGETRSCFCIHLVQPASSAFEAARREVRVDLRCAASATGSSECPAAATRSGQGR